PVTVQDQVLGSFKCPVVIVLHDFRGSDIADHPVEKHEGKPPVKNILEMLASISLRRYRNKQPVQATTGKIPDNIPFPFSGIVGDIQNDVVSIHVGDFL